MQHNHVEASSSRWSTAARIAFFGFAAIAAFFLITEHTAHLFGILPFLLLAACPLMHFFHHRDGHGGHGDSVAVDQRDASPPK